MTNPYVALLIMGGMALVVAIGGLATSAVLGPTRKNAVKAQNYECGIDPSPLRLEDGRFPVQYYLVAMTFIIFDIEVVFMYPWAVAFDQVGLFGLLSMLLFLVLITVPYIYEVRRGGLSWA